MRIFKTILLFIFLIVIVIFTIQNMENVKLSFLNWHIEIPVSLATVLIYIAGTITGGLLWSILKKLSLEKTIDNEK